jgi:nucleotidyltransferase/DNA polymerase involved in DNA repair
MAKGKKAVAEKKVETKAADKGQIEDIAQIEGIGVEYAKDLKKVGVKTTEDLRKISLVEISEVTGITPKLLYKWQCMADLFRLKRAAQEYTEVLFLMGIETVKEVSKQKAEDLVKQVEKFAKEADKKPGWQGDINKIPTLKDVEAWITSAKELVKKK